MRAVVCEKLGDATAPGVLKLSDVPTPTAGPGEIRVAVVAASLNFPDALQVRGEYQSKPKLPFIPGSEVSGTVVEVGPGATKFAVGDKVCAVTLGGAFAEQCVVPEAAAWRVPDGVEVAACSAVPIAYGTADLALRHRANLKAGQTVLVLGAAGGVGVAAIQIAKILGARVVAVASGAAKVDFLRSLGADVAIDASTASKDLPLYDLIRKAAPKGVDVVFDPVGGKQFNDAMKSVAWGAQYLIIGFASGSIPQVPANILLVKNTTLHGIFWGSYMQARYRVLQQSMDQVLQWAAEGKLKVHTSHRFPLDQVTDAFAVLLSRKVLGKVLILAVPAQQPRGKGQEAATQQRSRL